MLTVAKVRHVRFVAGGDLDVGNGDGLVVGWWCCGCCSPLRPIESSTKSRRVSARRCRTPKLACRTAAGTGPAATATTRSPPARTRPRSSAPWPSGSWPGESLRSLAVSLDEQSIATVSGKPWRTPTLVALLASGRFAGLRDHQGQVIGKAVWEPIIIEQTRGQVL